MKYKSEFLNILDQRGFIHQCSDFGGLDAKLCEGVQSAYVGYDATAPSLHVGSLISIMMLYWFQQCGHKPVTLMGGGTTKIGDPSGKDESRKLLDNATIDENIAGIKTVFEKFIRYGDGPTDAKMVNNNDWLTELKYLDFLRDYGRHFTINRMLSFDSVKTRLEREQPLTFLEFNYMILQAYDFVELRKRFDTALQMGGSDQWGNIINGVELGRRTANAELFGLTCPLLTTSSGAKMGKTAAGAVWLNMEYLAPYDYFQFWRNTEDADVARFLKLFTILPLDEIARLEKGHINDAKKVLAFEATKLCHGEDNAISARDTAQKVFEQGGTGGDLPVIETVSGAGILDIIVSLKMAASKGAARKLIEQGGVKIDNAPVNDFKYAVTAAPGTEIKLSVGKKHHALVRIR